MSYVAIGLGSDASCSVFVKIFAINCAVVALSLGGPVIAGLALGEMLELDGWVDFRRGCNGCAWRWLGVSESSPGWFTGTKIRRLATIWKVLMEVNAFLGSESAVIFGFPKPEVMLKGGAKS